MSLSILEKWIFPLVLDLEMIILARSGFGHNFLTNGRARPDPFFWRLGGLWASQKRLFSLFLDWPDFGQKNPLNFARNSGLWAQNFGPAR